MQRMKLALAERHFLPIAIATLQLLLALQLAEHIHCVAHLVSLLSCLPPENCLVQHSAVQCSVRKCQIAAGGQAQEALETLQTLETIRVMPSGGWHFLVSMSTLLHRRVKWTLLPSSYHQSQQKMAVVAFNACITPLNQPQLPTSLLYVKNNYFDFSI